MMPLSVCTPAQYADFLCDRLRCYLYPSLHKGYHPPRSGKAQLGPDGNGLSPPPKDFANDPTIWKQPNASDEWENPWSKNLKNVMFYL